MYRSPGLRDGVSSPGTCVQPYFPEIPEPNFNCLDFPVGNKSGRARVHKFI